MRTPHTTTSKRLFSSWRGALLAAALAFASTSALATQFAITYHGTVGVGTTIPEFGISEPYTITYVADNDRSTAIDQTWSGSTQLKCVIVRNASNTAAFAWDVSTGSAVSHNMGTIATDTNGVVQSVGPGAVKGTAAVGQPEWSTISLTGFSADPQMVEWWLPWRSGSRKDGVLGFPDSHTTLYDASGDLVDAMRVSTNWSNPEPFSGDCLVPIQPPAPNAIDLTLTKTMTSTGPYTPGSTATFKLLASNLGPGTAQPAIVVTDTLPAGLEFVSAAGTDWACSAAGQVVTCTRSGTAAALASGDAASPITLTTRVAAKASGTLTSRAFVAPAADETATETNLANSYDDGSPLTHSNNDDSVKLTVTLPPTPVPTLGHGALGLLSLLTLLTLRRRSP